MSLSHHERSALERIAVELHGEDPWLASTLTRDGWITSRRRQRIAAVGIFVVGAAMLASGIFIPPSIPAGTFMVSVLGYVVMFGAAVGWCYAPIRRRRLRNGRGSHETCHPDDIG